MPKPAVTWYINKIILVSIALRTGTTATAPPPPPCATAGTSMTSSCTNTNSCQLSSSALSPPGASESSASTSSGMITNISWVIEFLLCEKTWDIGICRRLNLLQTQKLSRSITGPHKP